MCRVVRNLVLVSTCMVLMTLLHLFCLVAGSKVMAESAFTSGFPAELFNAVA